MKIFMIYAYVGFLSIVLLAGCSKKEEFEGERVDVRLSTLLKAYEEQLTGASNGWIGYLYPAGGGGYTFKFNFDPSNRVQMYSTVKEDYATTIKESSYRLRATQVPSLYFDTYSYIHELADPDPSVSEGSTGEGHLSDFEFAILDVSEDTIRMKGNLNGSEFVLIRATAEQGDDFVQQAYAQLEKIKSIETFPFYYNRLTWNGKDYNITFNTDASTISFYSDGDFHNITYVVTDDGIVLQEPFQDGQRSISSLSQIEIDAAAHEVHLQSSSGESMTVINEASPTAIDIDAPRRMYNETYQYTSAHGFTVNGAVDGFKLNLVPGFAGCVFVPRQYVDGYDAFHVLLNWGSTYITPVFHTEFDENKIFFKDVLGYASNGSQDYVDIIMIFLTSHFTQLRDEQGYYVYQTGKNSYDLVSAGNAGIWMRLQ